MEQVDPKTKLVANSTTDQSRKFNPGAWNHYGWSPPDNFDDSDPEIEELFYGDGAV